MKSKSQSGVALVITLLMLSVITFLTVAFLAVSRRDRASVTVSLDQKDARSMAEAALARAQSEIISRMSVTNKETGLSEWLSYDLLVSKNFVNPNGFSRTPGYYTNLNNVNYAYYENDPTKAPLTIADQVQNIANLFYDPRPPVFVKTNANINAPLDFRFWMDLNRNGMFEDSGYLTVTNDNGPVKNGNVLVTNLFEGEPQWIGLLRYPEVPHSATNPFMGRYAYVVQPIGKSLDWNYIHNHAKDTNGVPVTDFFFRGQGIGSWEINLGGLLAQVNTNSWNTYSYTNLNVVNPGVSFADANSILTNRFDARMPIVGSNNIKTYYNPQELFDPTQTSPFFVNRLYSAGTNRSSYNRYTMQRLLASIGTESAPDLQVDLGSGKPWNDQWTNLLRTKVNINDDNTREIVNRLNSVNTNYARWTPLGFFTNAADIIIRSEYGNPYSLTNIPVYCSTNANIRYDARLHRCLQLAANIYDATTNSHAVSLDPNFPSVFRPLFTQRVVAKKSTNLFITGFIEVTNDINAILARGFKLPQDPTIKLNDNVYGIPLVVGAKKGLPNFNEYSASSRLSVSRKLRFFKADPKSPKPPTETNQMYLFSITNVSGVELWNSYTQAYKRNVEIIISNQVSMSFTNYDTNRPSRTLGASTNRLYTNYLHKILPAGAWPSYDSKKPNPGNFIVAQTNVLVLPYSQYLFASKLLRTNDGSNLTIEGNISGLPVSSWQMFITNRVIYALIDPGTKRVLDFVNLNEIVNYANLNAALSGDDENNNPWLTNGANYELTSPPSLGVSNQIAFSLYGGSLGRHYVNDPNSKLQSSGFRSWWNGETDATNSQYVFAPYQAQSTVELTMSYQANDPLVHYTLDDLSSPYRVTANTASLGTNNSRYKPWTKGTEDSVSGDITPNNLLFKDPQIYGSDDWDFPTNKFSNVGWIGRVHRGTPWQTIYLKADPNSKSNQTSWQTKWVSDKNLTTYPTNDWALLDLFTVAPNNNAAYGTLSVNQTNVAPWAAVLSGTMVTNNNGSPVAIHPTNAVEILDGYSTYTVTNSINAVRLRKQGHIFHRMGEILEAETLTTKSPFVGDPTQNTNVTDAVLEAIPQKTMSLLKVGQPRFVVWAYGQSLKPAQNSMYMRTPNFGICTNYQITGESLTRTVCRVEGDLTNPKIVVENFNVVP